MFDLINEITCPLCFSNLKKFIDEDTYQAIDCCCHRFSKQKCLNRSSHKYIVCVHAKISFTFFNNSTLIDFYEEGKGWINKISINKLLLPLNKKMIDKYLQYKIFL